MEGRPARMDPEFIWQTEPTWFRPSAQQERMMDISSTCSAMLGYQSETQAPLWPYCLKVRFEPRSVLLPVPMAVMGLPKEAGMGWPLSSVSLGLGSKRSTWLGPPSMNNQITDLALGSWWGFLGASGSTMVEEARRPSW